MKTKQELEAYALENRKRLDAQEVKLGDVVKVLRGRFAGEKGVIVGIIACGNDYTDPYYEVDMACEVPDKYKCRKTLITPNNVVGGFNACDFIVCGNRAPEKPTDEIKVGDRVVAHVGENMDWIGAVLKIIPDTDGLFGENLLQIRVDGGCLLEHRVSRCIKIEDKPNDHTITIPVMVDLDDTYWQHYRAELASKIAVAYAEKGRYEPTEIGAYAVKVANDVVDNLKKQSE